MSLDYAHALGARLRAVRGMKGLTLHDVEEKSGGRWKAVVIGSYERADRSMTVVKLAELAQFYGVRVGELLPESIPDLSFSPPELVINMRRLAELPTKQTGPLARYAAAVQTQRHDRSGDTLAIRAEDLRTLAVICDMAAEDLMKQFVRLGVLVPKSS